MLYPTLCTHRGEAGTERSHHRSSARCQVLVECRDRESPLAACCPGRSPAASYGPRCRYPENLPFASCRTPTPNSSADPMGTACAQRRPWREPKPITACAPYRCREVLRHPYAKLPSVRHRRSGKCRRAPIPRVGSSTRARRRCRLRRHNAVQPSDRPRTTESGPSHIQKRRH